MFPTEFPKGLGRSQTYSHGSVTPVIFFLWEGWICGTNSTSTDWNESKNALAVHDIVQRVDIDWPKTLVSIQRLIARSFVRPSVRAFVRSFACLCLFVRSLTSQKNIYVLLGHLFERAPPKNRHLSLHLDLVEKLTPIKKTPKNAGKSWRLGNTSCFSFWPGAVLTEFFRQLVTRHTDSDWINGRPFAVRKAFLQYMVLESFIMENF